MAKYLQNYVRYLCWCHHLLVRCHPINPPYIGNNAVWYTLLPPSNEFQHRFDALPRQPVSGDGNELHNRTLETEFLKRGSI